MCWTSVHATDLNTLVHTHIHAHVPMHTCKCCALVLLPLAPIPVEAPSCMVRSHMAKKATNLY